MDEAFARAAEGASAIPDLIAQPSLDCLPNQSGRVGTVELVDGYDPRGRGHVDLGQPAAADDVDPGEQDAALLELGAEDGANLFLALGKLGLRGFATDGEVGADFAFARNAVDGAGNLPVDQHDPFVALGDLGDEFLDHVRL